MQVVLLDCLQQQPRIGAQIGREPEGGQLDVVPFQLI